MGKRGALGEQNIPAFLDQLKEHLGAESDADLAERTGFSGGKISDLRRGRITVTLATLVKLEQRVGLPVSTSLAWLHGLKRLPAPIAGGSDAEGPTRGIMFAWLAALRTWWYTRPTWTPTLAHA